MCVCMCVCVLSVLSVYDLLLYGLRGCTIVIDECLLMDDVVVS